MRDDEFDDEFNGEFNSEIDGDVDNMTLSHIAPSAQNSFEYSAHLVFLAFDHHDNFFHDFFNYNMFSKQLKDSTTFSGDGNRIMKALQIDSSVNAFLIFFNVEKLKNLFFT